MFLVNNFNVCLNIERNHEDRIPIDPLCRFHLIQLPRRRLKRNWFFNKYALFTVEVARIVINISNAFLSLTYKESDLINNKL